MLALGSVGLDVPRLEQELEEIDPAELVERHQGPFDGLALPVDPGPERADVRLDGGQVGPAPFELDVPGGQLPLDDALVEVDPGQ